MRIGLDVMGGDFAPQATMEGAVKAAKMLGNDDKIVLIGQQSAIMQELERLQETPSLFDIVDADEVIEMDDKPVKALKQKPNSSLAVGFRLLMEGKIDSFASAGNTGAMLVGAMTTGVLEGVLRPCLMTALPRIDGGVCLLVDSGVNPDCKPENLYQFGLLGSMYAKCVLKIDEPKVGLLNLGTEAGKGNLLTTAAYQLMNETKDFNFIGNVEPRTLFNSNCDVFVCDGFVGNMMLKLLETFWYTTTKRGHTDEYLARFNYELYGGTPILGVNKPAIVGHGISSALAIQNMILQSRDIANANLAENLKTMLNK